MMSVETPSEAISLASHIAPFVDDAAFLDDLVLGFFDDFHGVFHTALLGISPLLLSSCNTVHSLITTVSAKVFDK